jgi:hypothetical protein
MKPATPTLASWAILSASASAFFEGSFTHVGRAFTGFSKLATATQIPDVENHKETQFLPVCLQDSNYYCNA